MSARVLIVDDDASMCSVLVEGLRRREYEAIARSSAAEALDALSTAVIDVVVTDLRMAGTDGIELCSRVVSSHPGIPVVVITAFGSIETAVAAIRAGAYDFVTKPIDIDILKLVLDRAVKHHALFEEVSALRRAVDETRRLDDDLYGASPAMRRVYDLIVRVADSDATVLITGESGTGKECVARALHRRSRRAAGPFVALNCAAMPEALLESELFGHARGAFTDAHAARPGLFLKANGGTLLLDEIGDMPLGLQPKLLRALQERTVRPVGGDAEVSFDVRILASTNRDLETAVEEGRFRQDLFFRINVVAIDVPPLRARANDVLLLAQHFVEQFATRDGKRVKGISPEAATRLLAYDWPGNVRELQNGMERAVLLTRRDEIGVEDLPAKIQEYRSTQVLVGGEDPSDLLPMEEVERRYIRRVLQVTGGNKTLAARVLGFDRKTLYRKLERYGAEGGTEP